MHEEGVSYADQARRFSHRVSQYRTCYLGLTLDRSTLYERIDQRVDEMIEHGLINEARQLYEHGLSDSYTASAAIGYKELFEYFSGDLGIDEAIEKLKKRTRNYAKRQMTWFRSDERIQWIAVDGRPSDEVARTAIAMVDQFNQRS